MTLISAGAQQRASIAGRDVLCGEFGVTYWPTWNAAYTGRAHGLGVLYERAAGSAWGEPRAAALPIAYEDTHTSAALELALHIVAKRWKPSILLYLADGPQRRRDLEQRLPSHVSAKVLTAQLRALEADGLVHRIDRTPAGHGRHVTYALTELGLTLGPAMRTLAGWAIEHREDLLPGRCSGCKRDGTR